MNECLPTSELLIRKATPEDASSIARVNYFSWMDAFRGLLPDSELDSLDIEILTNLWKHNLNADDSRSCTLVVLYKSVAVAYSRFYPSVDSDDDSALVATIGSSYVLPELQGRGIGNKLVSAVLLALKDHGFLEVTLHVLATNQRARNFYEHLSWAEDLELFLEQSEGESARKIRYRKRIDREN